jgi:hypothetical protein
MGEPISEQQDADESRTSLVKRLSANKKDTKSKDDAATKSKRTRGKRPPLRHSLNDEVMSNSFRMNERSGGGRRLSSKVLAELDLLDVEYLNTTKESVVTFDRVHIMHIARRLGENPSVRFGAPVALGTECLSKESFPIDEFENEKPQTRRRRRVPMLTGPERLRLLTELGYRPKDIIKAAISAAEERGKRTKAAAIFIHEYGTASILKYSAEQEQDDEPKQNTFCGCL